MPPRPTTAPGAAARRAELVDRLIELFFAEGFLRSSLEDLARRLGCSKSTLYLVADSKEQIIQAVVREIFRRSTASVEERVAAEPDPRARIGTYLESIAAELAPAGPAYFADLDAYAPAREVYRQNTAIAAERVQDLVRAAGLGDVDPSFAGVVAGLAMEAIHRGEVGATTGLSDSAAFHQLALLITAGVAGTPERTTAP